MPETNDLNAKKKNEHSWQANQWKNPERKQNFTIHTWIETLLGVLELQYPEPLSSWRLMGCPMKSALKTEQALDFALPGLEKPIEGQGPKTPLVLEPSMLSGTHKTLFEEQAISQNQRSCQALRSWHENGLYSI